MTRIVQATAFGGPENLALATIDLPAPGPGEVRISVRAAGVNPIDLKVYSGLMGTDPSMLPRRLGSEAAGVVTAVGTDAVGPAGPVAVGDEVIAFRVSGAYAEELVVAATAVVPKPAAMPWAEAGGLMLTGATAVHALTAANVGPGDVVLVHGGAGGVGLMAVQLAVIRGARVIATASPGKHDLLTNLGAEPLVYGDGLSDRVAALAPGGVDVALDLIGTDEALASSLALVADRARIVTIANFAGGAAAGITVLGGGPGADPGTEIRDAARTELTALVAEGRLRVVVADTFDLAEVAAAHALVGTGHVTGKVVLLPRP